MQVRAVYRKLEVKGGNEDEGPQLLGQAISLPRLDSQHSQLGQDRDLRIRVHLCLSVAESGLCTRMTFGGGTRTKAVPVGRSAALRSPRDNSCCTNAVNASIWRCISAIFSRMLRMISIPARLTPMSRVRVKMTSRRSRSVSV